MKIAEIAGVTSAIFFIAAWIFLAYQTGYESGQRDALEGKQSYQMVTGADGQHHFFKLENK